jgi:predicted outer membrane repeat protein
MITHNASMIVATQLQAMSLALNYVSNVIPQGHTAFVSMSGMIFQSNVANGLGGAYYLMAAYRVSCLRCLYDSNVASGSGAIAAGTRSILSVTDSIFNNNNAINLLGGAMSIQQASVGIIKGCTFTNNVAAQFGGAIAVGSLGTVTVTNSIFDGNQAQQGSILYNDATSKVSITGCTTRNNIATIQGGIVLLNPVSAAKYNITSNTYFNNQANGNYGADYASVPTSLVFVPADITDLGLSRVTPSILPSNTTTQLSRSINNLDSITLRILLIDSFGQRMDLNSSNQTDLYADIMTLDNKTTPALLVESTRVRMPNGLADVEVVIVGEMTKTYAVQWSVDMPGVAPIRLLVTIQSCNPYDVVTYYEATNFPICHTAPNKYISDSLFNGIIIVSCILIACVLLVQGLTIWYWNTPVFKGSTPLFMSLMLLGAIIGYLATILSVLDVNHTNQYDIVCKSQYWMMGVAFVLMFATLALKTWRIRNIFCNETLTEIRTVNTWGLLRWLAIVLAIEMAIHIIWISVDPLHSTLVLSTGALSHTCSSTYDHIFLIVNLVYKGLIAAVCVLFAYQTRDVISKFNESRQLMIASYNMFVCVIVIAALSLALPSVDARRTVYSVGALFVITSTWFVLFTPKLYLAIFKSDLNVSNTATGGSGGKNSHSQEQRKYSFGKGTYHNQQSKSSFNNGNGNTGSATPSRSKAGSAANTAPGSPMIQPHKLSLNLGTRASVSAMTPSPIAGSSPHMSAMIHIPRHLSVASRPSDAPAPSTTQDDIILSIPALDLTGLNEPGARRASQPAIQPNQPGTGGNSAHGSGSYTPAKNFI